LLRFSAAYEAIDDAAQILQVTSDELVHQVGLGPAHGAAHLKADTRISRHIDRLEVFANSPKELAPHFFTHSELRFEVKFTFKGNCPGGGKPDVLGAKKQFVDCDHSRID